MLMDLALATGLVGLEDQNADEGVPGDQVAPTEDLEVVQVGQRSTLAEVRCEDPLVVEDTGRAECQGSDQNKVHLVGHLYHRL